MSKTAEQIDAEVSEMAEKLAKSTKDSKQLLFDTIMELGPEGLKKAAEDLSPEDQVILKSALDEMAKSRAEDADKLTPKKDITPANSMKQESFEGSDEEDEKLMKDSDKNQNPQGGPKDKPEGWEGQVIKGADLKPEEKQAVKKLIPMEEKEHGKDLDGDGKVGEEKEAKMKKSLEEIVEMAKSLGMSKEEVVKSIKECGDDLELAKGKMKEMMADKEAKAKAPSAIEAIKEAVEGEKKEDKPEDKKPEMPAKIEKSVQWTPKNTIAAFTGGRNAHYAVDEMIVKSAEERAEIMAKGGYFGETEGQPLVKSENQKADLNDLIEKGMDYSTDEIKRIEGVQNHKVEGRIVKSFHDEDIAKALGISEEEYKKLMGE